MAFKEVLRFLYERAKAKGEIASQDEFAERHGMAHATINQFITGNLVPPARTMWRIIEREGYKLDDCLDLPEIRAERDSYIAAAEQILKRRDKWGERLRDYINDIQRHIQEQPARASPSRKKRRA